MAAYLLEQKRERKAAKKAKKAKHRSKREDETPEERRARKERKKEKRRRKMTQKSDGLRGVEELLKSIGGTSQRRRSASPSHQDRSRSPRATRQQQQRRERGPFFRVFFPSLFSFFLLSLAHFFTFVWNREGERSQSMARTQKIFVKHPFFSLLFLMFLSLSAVFLHPCGEESFLKKFDTERKEREFLNPTLLRRPPPDLP